MAAHMYHNFFSGLSRSILIKVKTGAAVSASQCRYLQIHSKGIRRFYKNVSITSVNKHYEINLDQRRLKSPMGKVLKVPNEVTALAIAAEWDAQEEKIKPSTMHFTKLANTVVDNPTDRSREQIISGILEYLDTDTVCYRIEEPEDFVEIQTKFWDTLIQAVEDRYKVKIPVTTGFDLTSIPQETKDTLRQHLNSHEDWSLIGYQFTVEALKSFIIALALCDGMINTEDAVYLARLEQEYQAQKWGRVEWYHDIEMMDTRAKVAASAAFVHFFSEHRDVKEKGRSIS